MASTYFYVGGAVTLSKNVWKIEDDGTTLSIATSYLAVGAATVNAIVQDLDGNIYIAAGNAVAKYSSSMVLDTTWATSGLYSIANTVYSLAVDPGGYLAIMSTGSAGVDNALLDPTGTKVWDTSSGKYGGQVSFDAAGNVYATSGASSGVFMGIKMRRKAPYSALVNYTAASGTCIGTGGKVFPDNYVVAVRNFTSNNSSLIRIYENDATVIKGSTLVTIGDAQGVYIPPTSTVYTDPFYVLGTNTGTKTLHKLQYDAIDVEFDVLASYDINNPIRSGNQVHFNTSGNILVASDSVADEDANTAQIRIFDTELTLLRFLSDTTNMGVLHTISGVGVADTPIVPYFPPTAVKTYSKKLVSVGNNEVWYESPAGTKVELAAANGDIDTAKPIDIFEYDEKVFIVNDTNKKVVDFGNIKLTTADIGSHPPDFRTILIGDSSGASMVVDYITALSGACVVYGKRTTTATFTAEVISGTDDDGNDIDFTLSAVETAPDPPHWYDWSPFGDSANVGDTAYGAMPSNATIGCNYRGRAVTSGDKYYPHQWYQPRQGNPWDFNYIADDAQSPIRGNDADAGEIGDIVIALIPYKDDFLIYACANNLWFQVGDVAEGGGIHELELTAGILGKKAWCWDKEENLYILGTTGILKIPKGFGQIENLTEITYPDFIEDLAFDSSLHIATMGYDRQKHGIKISKTTLASGVNSCWWFDLRTQGLFPESYPNVCGIYSMFWYESVDPDYRGLLFGCRDGLIRYSDSAAVDDDSGDSDTAVDSYVTFGPIAIGGENKEGVLTGMNVVSAGGASGGSESDSNDIDFKVWTGLSAGDVTEKLIANTSPQIAGTVTAPGRRRGSAIRRKVRGAYLGLRLGNDTAAETWGLEKVILDLKGGGRIK